MKRNKAKRLAHVRNVARLTAQYPFKRVDDVIPSPYVCDNLDREEHAAYNNLYGEGILGREDDWDAMHRGQVCQITFRQMDACDPNWIDEARFGSVRDATHAVALIPQRLMMLAFFHTLIEAGDA